MGEKQEPCAKQSAFMPLMCGSDCRLDCYCRFILVSYLLRPRKLAIVAVNGKPLHTELYIRTVALLCQQLQLAASTGAEVASLVLGDANLFPDLCPPLSKLKPIWDEIWDQGLHL